MQTQILHPERLTRRIGRLVSHAPAWAPAHREDQLSFLKRSTCVIQRSTTASFSINSQPQELVKRAWMFDVDGVLVSLMTKRVNAFLVKVLAQRLIAGEPVTFNSGRSPISIAELVLSHLEEQITDKSLLQRVMVVGEKDGSWATYGPDGKLQVAFDTTLKVPSVLLWMLRELLEDSEFCDLMEIEEGKRTMVSVIKRSGIPLDAFQQAQAKFVPLAQDCLMRLGFDTAWKVDPVSDSTEIEHKSANKGKSARRIVRWLHDQGLQPQHVVTVEDSPSGIAMAEALHQMQIAVSFVFTGHHPLPHRSYAFPIIQTQSKYENGTIEYLSQYQEALSV